MLLLRGIIASPSRGLRGRRPAVQDSDFAGDLGESNRPDAVRLARYAARVRRGSPALGRILLTFCNQINFPSPFQCLPYVSHRAVRVNSRKANVAEAPDFKPSATETIPGTMRAHVALEEGNIPRAPGPSLFILTSVPTQTSLGARTHSAP